MSYRQSLKPIFFLLPKNFSRYRFILLLLLTFYAAVSLLRLSLSPATPSSPSGRLQPTDDHPSPEDKTLIRDEAVSKESESNLKTHIQPEKKNLLQSDERRRSNPVSCSALIDGRSAVAAAGDGEGLVCCDRSNYRSDVCYLRGDVRMDASSKSIIVYGVGGGAPEKIRPYTRKFEKEIMSTISEITTRPVNGSSPRREPACDVRHDGVPGVVFSAGGYTGNLYHEFSDGLIPAYVTAGRFRGEVVLVVTEMQAWWFGKYRRALERLSNYRVVDFAADHQIHCFSEMIVGLRIHGEMLIDPNLMPNGESIQDFQNFLHESFSGVESTELPPHRISPLLRSRRGGGSGRPCGGRRRLKLVIFTRRYSRVLQNLQAIVRTCRSAGFDVQVINPAKGFPLEALDDALQSADAMVAVHGAAASHFLLMRPGASVFVQVVPLGLEWPAAEFYGGPARRLGLEYMPYAITPEESSLSREYNSSSEVLRNPSAITSRGWNEMKKIYLDHQNVTLNTKRFGQFISRVRSHICSLPPPDLNLNLN